jgi:hypothetical protein
LSEHMGIAATMQALFYLITGVTWMLVAAVAGRGSYLTLDQLLSWEVSVTGGLGNARTEPWIGLIGSLFTAVAW